MTDLERLDALNELVRRAGGLECLSVACRAFYYAEANALLKRACELAKARVALKSHEYSLGWIKNNPDLARASLSDAIGVELDLVECSGDMLCVRLLGDAQRNCVTCELPNSAAFALKDYLGNPPGVSFDFTRQGFLTVHKKPA